MPERTSPVPQGREPVGQPDYSWGDVVYWILGVLSIPLVPLLMIWFLTPWRGM